MTQFDLNKDGKIDDAERLAVKRQRFEKLDTNRDRVITLAELQAAKEAHHNQRAAKRAMNPNKSGRQGEAHKGSRGGDPGQRMAERFAKIDANQNGSLSWQEFAADKVRNHGRKGKRKGRGKG